MNNMVQELVILVDENDNETGVMAKMEAHRKAELHRAISVFICNSRGEWLLQRRASNKYHSKGLWSNACCSHPMPGETIQDAANRRLTEEMGIKATLKKLFHFMYKVKFDDELTEHEFDHVFFGITDEKPDINFKEVEEWSYVPYDRLWIDIYENPDKYTYWFKLIFHRVREHIAGDVPGQIRKS